MNFLGHLYFSNNDHLLMYANLFGDFVKGSNLSVYADTVQKGIRLHRRIDNYIDHHPIVTELQHTLHRELPRISGIATDLFFDHLLARHWADYHPLSLEKFVGDFHNFQTDKSLFPSTEFWHVLKMMQEGSWLVNYQTSQGLQFACSGLSRRISFENNLDTAPLVFERHSERIELAFRTYMHDAQLFFGSTRTNDQA